MKAGRNASSRPPAPASRRLRAKPRTDEGDRVRSRSNSRTGRPPPRATLPLHLPSNPAAHRGGEARRRRCGPLHADGHRRDPAPSSRSAPQHPPPRNLQPARACTAKRLRPCRSSSRSAAVSASRATHSYPLELRQRQRGVRSEEHTSELQSRENLVCRLLLEKKKQQQ